MTSNEEKLARELGFRVNDNQIEYAAYDEDERFAGWLQGNFVQDNIQQLWRKCLELTEQSRITSEIVAFLNEAQSLCEYPSPTHEDISRLRRLGKQAFPDGVAHWLGEK